MSNYIKPRIRKSFSNRTGLAPISKEIQIETFSIDTRRCLQNQLFILIDEHVSYLGNLTYISNYMSMIAREAFNLESDSRNYYSKDYIYNLIRF